ncbi:ABC transporter substrate-binding protein [Bradyrhizobium japonicum]
MRQAFELAIDRNVINRVAFNGEFLADNQMIPPSSPFYDSARKAPARDVAKAKAMIAAAGITRVPVEIQYENTAGDSRVAQIIQSMAGEAGFDVKLLPMETTTAIERYMNGNFEAYIGNWSGRADPDPTLVAFFSCAGSQNVNKYCNKDLDAILNQARGEADEAKRKALYAKATDIYLTALSSNSPPSPELVLCGPQIGRRHRHGAGRSVASGRCQACELMRNASRPTMRSPW